MIKKIYITTIAALLMVFVGCDSILEIDQPDVVEDENAFKTYNEGLVSIIGCYQGLQEAVDQIFLLANLRSDLVLANDNAPAYFRELSDVIYTKGNPYIDASVFYKVVNQTNDVISNMDKLMANDPENVDKTVVSKFTAEATVVRALAYLFIIQNYKDIYYYEEPLTEYSEAFNLAPMQKADVVDKLIQQVEFYMYEKNVGQFVTNDQISNNFRWYKFRFGEYAPIHQLLAELYLEKGDYANAFKELYQIIDLQDDSRADRFSLSSKFGLSNWRRIFESYAYTYNTADEILLTVPFFKKQNQTHSIQYWCSNKADGVYYLKPSPKCISYFASQGEFGDLYRGEGTSYVIEDGQPIINKYMINSGLYDNDNSFSIFRAGDSWLDACEALNHMGKPSEALLLMNSGEYMGEQIQGVSLGVRGRVFLKPLNINHFEPVRTLIEMNEEVTLSDSIRAVDMAILEERAREQAFETSRFYDIRRIAEYWNDPTIIANIISSKYSGIDEGRASIIYERLLSKENWYIQD